MEEDQAQCALALGRGSSTSSRFLYGRAPALNVGGAVIAAPMLCPIARGNDMERRPFALPRDLGQSIGANTPRRARGRPAGHQPAGGVELSPPDT